MSCVTPIVDYIIYSITLDLYFSPQIEADVGKMVSVALYGDPHIKYANDAIASFNETGQLLTMLDCENLWFHATLGKANPTDLATSILGISVSQVTIFKTSLGRT